jgi:hypothetical protein
MTKGERTSMGCFLQPSTAIGAHIGDFLAAGVTQTDAVHCARPHGVAGVVRHSKRRHGDGSLCCLGIGLGGNELRRSPGQVFIGERGQMGMKQRPKTYLK